MKGFYRAFGGANDHSDPKLAAKVMHANPHIEPKNKKYQAAVGGGASEQSPTNSIVKGQSVSRLTQGPKAPRRNLPQLEIESNVNKKSYEGPPAAAI